MKPIVSTPETRRAAVVTRAAAVAADVRAIPHARENAARMKDLYLFTDRPAAEHYAAEFGYAEVVAVTVPKGAILARWTPSYCISGRVLRVGLPCPVVPLEPPCLP